MKLVKSIARKGYPSAVWESAEYPGLIIYQPHDDSCWQVGLMGEQEEIKPATQLLHSAPGICQGEFRTRGEAVQAVQVAIILQ